MLEQSLCVKLQLCMVFTWVMNVNSSGEWAFSSTQILTSSCRRHWIAARFCRVMYLNQHLNQLCWIRIFGTADLCINCKYHTTELLVGLFTFCITLESHWRTVCGIVGCFFSLKLERYTQWLPFGTSLNLLYGGFVFLSLLCGIHSLPWLSVTYKYSSKLH